MKKITCHKCKAIISAETFEILNKLAIEHDKLHKKPKKPEPNDRKEGKP